MKPKHYELKGKTFNNEPTMTDQSQARDTDINVIVGAFGIANVTGATGTPMYEDWTEMPTDLRGWIEQARSLEQHRNALPDALKTMDIQELLGLTPEQLAAKLKPADKPAEKADEPPKGDK